MDGAGKSQAESRAAKHILQNKPQQHEAMKLRTAQAEALVRTALKCIPLLLPQHLPPKGLVHQRQALEYTP